MGEKEREGSEEVAAFAISFWRVVTWWGRGVIFNPWDVHRRYIEHVLM